MQLLDIFTLALFGVSILVSMYVISRFLYHAWTLKISLREILRACLSGDRDDLEAGTGDEGDDRPYVTYTGIALAPQDLSGRFSHVPFTLCLN